MFVSKISIAPFIEIISVQFYGQHLRLISFQNERRASDTLYFIVRSSIIVILKIDDFNIINMYVYGGVY